MELRLPLILLCVSTSLSIEDNETEGRPITVLNISYEDYEWTHILEGRPILNFSSEDYGGMPYVDGHPLPFFSSNDYGGELYIDGHPIYFKEGSPTFAIIKLLSDAAYLYPDKKKFNSTELIYILLLKTYLSSWWLTKFVPSVYTMVLLVALPLNIMAIIMFLVKVKVKKPGVVYLLNLAAADVLFVSILPFHIVYRFSGNNWLMGEGMCRFVTAAFYSNMRGSILLMTSISVDRFLALVYPIKSLPWRTMRRAWLVCCCIWTISIASTMPLLIRQQTQKLPFLKITTCSDVQDADFFYKFYVYFYFPIYIALLYFLPLIITTFCYIGIVRSLSARSIKGAQKRSRAVFLTVVVLCLFVLCFGPANVIWFMHYLQIYKEASTFLYTVYIVCVSMSSVSCCLDPLIYYYASSQWQRHVYSLMGCRREYEALDNRRKSSNKPPETSRFK